MCVSPVRVAASAAYLTALTALCISPWTTDGGSRPSSASRPGSSRDGTVAKSMTSFCWRIRGRSAGFSMAVVAPSTQHDPPSVGPGRSGPRTCGQKNGQASRRSVRVSAKARSSRLRLSSRFCGSSAARLTKDEKVLGLFVCGEITPVPFRADDAARINPVPYSGALFYWQRRALLCCLPVLHSARGVS